MKTTFHVTLLGPQNTTPTNLHRRWSVPAHGLNSGRAKSDQTPIEKTEHLAIKPWIQRKLHGIMAWTWLPKLSDSKIFSTCDVSDIVSKNLHVWHVWHIWATYCHLSVITKWLCQVLLSLCFRGLSHTLSTSVSLCVVRCWAPKICIFQNGLLWRWQQDERKGVKQRKICCH